MTDEMHSAVPPAASVAAAVNAVPTGYVRLYDEQGREVLVREADRLDAERAHGLTPEQYDVDAAAQQWAAAYAAVPDTLAQALDEFHAYGCVRDEMYAALNQCMGGMVDAYRWLFRCVQRTVPREAAVADVAHLAATGGIDALAPSHPARALLPLAEKLPPERLELHRAAWARDAAERAAEGPAQ